MFKAVLLAVALSLPNLHGLATWYDPCVRFGQGDEYQACCQRDNLMRNEQPFRLDAPTVAVDTSHWPEWNGGIAIILTEHGQLCFAEVTDTGMLYAAGWFRWGVDELDTLRYWPTTTTNIKWRAQPAYQIVADFPRGTYRGRIARISHGGVDTALIRMWVVKVKEAQ